MLTFNTVVDASDEMQVTEAKEFCKEVTIMAGLDNSGWVKVGFTNNLIYTLNPGDSCKIDIHNSTRLFAQSENGTETISGQFT